MGYNSINAITFDSRAEGIMKSRNISIKEQVEFSDILNNFNKENNPSNAKQFLNSLSEDQLELVEKVSGFNDSIDISKISNEGAYNMLLCPGQSYCDLNGDGVEDVGDSNFVTFPPGNAPEAVKNVWNTVTAGLTEGEKENLMSQISETTYLNENGTFSKISGSDRTLEYYKNLTNNYIVYLNKAKNYISQDEYTKGINFAEAFLDKL